MDHSRLPGLLCLLLPLLCGCNDPGFELRRAAYNGNAAAVEKILRAHPEVVNDREKPNPVPAVAPGAPRASTAWVDNLFTDEEENFFSANRNGMTPLHLAVTTGGKIWCLIRLLSTGATRSYFIFKRTPFE